jgi:hypothetical protein
VGLELLETMEQRLPKEELVEGVLATKMRLEIILQEHRHRSERVQVIVWAWFMELIYKVEMV